MKGEQDKESWAIVSLMGHKTIAGRLSEEERFGSKLGRLDVPDGDTFATVYFGGQSVYSIEVVTEEVARAKAQDHTLRPVDTWRVPDGEQLDRPARSLPAYRDPEDDPDRRHSENDDIDF